MIHHIVQFALRQRFLMMIITLLIVIAGAESFRRMPVDAYPDLSPPMVELITQWPGHAAEEVERLTTLPLELAMNGTPNLKVMRSISLYGLSDVILTFDDSTEPYFARQVVFQRFADATLPTGVTPSMAPLSVRAASSIATSSIAPIAPRWSFTLSKTGSSSAPIAAFRRRR